MRQIRRALGESALSVERLLILTDPAADELAAELRRLLADAGARATMRKAALGAVREGSGATERTLDLLRSRGILHSPRARDAREVEGR